MKLRTIGLLAAAGFIAGAAQAKMEKFTAALAGDQEVPANTGSGTGAVTATLDTDSKKLSYDISFSGLSGPATMAHFHGPALAGANAPPVVPISNPVSPVKGSATLTDAQISDLSAGKWYFNVHTMAHPGGEIRGQLKEAK
jgi:hypothetical protein